MIVTTNVNRFCFCQQVEKATKKTRHDNGDVPNSTMTDTPIIDHASSSKNKVILQQFVNYISAT